MNGETRKTAIDIIADVPWGTHLCQFYQTKEDLTDILVPYFQAGLKHNEFCMWITSEPLNVEDAKRALKKEVKNLDDYIKRGQIEILDYRQWYTKPGYFDSDKVLGGWIEKEKQALEKGFHGLRLSGNTFWLEKEDWGSFKNYEATVNSIIGKYRMLAICTYSLDNCTASEIIDVVSNHQFAIIKREGKWEVIESAEYKKTSKELKSSEARYRAIVQDQTELICRFLPDKTLTFANGAYCRYFGKELQELVGHKFLPLIPKADQEKIQKHLSSFTPENAVAINLHRVIAPDGEIRWQEWSNRAIFDEEGNLIEFQSVGRDITERKQTEEELHRHASIVSSSSDMMAILDTNFVYLATNEAYLAAFGMTKDEVVGHTVSEVFGEEFFETVIKPNAEHCLKGNKVSYENWIQFPVHGSRFMSISYSPYIGPDGDIRGFVVDAKDITERKKAEEALKLHEVGLQGLLDLNSMGEASEQQIQDFVREGVLDITQSKLSFTGFMNNDESVMTIENWSREVMERCAVVDKPMHFPTAEAGLWGEVVRQRKPVIVNDYAAENDLKKGFPKGHVPITRFLSVPVFDGERIVTIAAVANKKEDYNEADVRALTSMMNNMWRLIQRKRAEEQVESLARFPFENRNPVLRISADGILLYANPAADSIINEWDCRTGQIVPEDWKSRVTEALADDRQKRMEYQHDDRIFAFLVVPVTHADYVNLYGRDITDRRQAERKIENLARFPSENPNPVLRIDKNGTVLYANAAGSKLLAKSGCEAGSGAPERWNQNISRILKSGSNKELEVSCAGRIYSLIMAPVASAGYVNLYGIDITERKHAEEGLEGYRRHLEELVETRTAELTKANELLLAQIEGRKLLEREILDISERERRRLGEELHDSLGQQLTGIAFMTKVLERKLSETSPNEAADVVEISKLVEQATEQARGLAKGFHPLDLGAESLMSSLEELARQTRELIGVRCFFRCDETVKVDDAGVAVHLYRIAQEAVTNAIKHGKAKNIEIALLCNQDISVMTIRNDGLDFPKEFEARSTGMGLQIMDHRVDLIGGSLDIHAGDEGGTILTCTFPNKNRG